MWKEYHLGHNLSVKVTRVQAPSQTLDNSDSASFITGTPTIYLHKAEYAPQHIHSRVVDFLAPRALSRGSDKQIHASSWTADPFGNKGSTPRLGGMITSPANRRMIHGSASPKPVPDLRRQGLARHTRHISSETELHAYQAAQSRGKSGNQLKKPSSGYSFLHNLSKGYLRGPWASRRQTLSEIPRTVGEEKPTQVRQGDSRQARPAEGPETPAELETPQPSSMDDARVQQTQAPLDGRLRAIFEGTFRAAEWECSADPPNTRVSEQVAVGAVASGQHRRQTTASSGQVSFKKESSAGGTEEAVDSGALRQTVLELESQWQTLFVQCETTDSALALLKKDCGKYSTRVGEFRENFTQELAKCEEKMLFHWKKVWSLVHEDELKARIERFLEVLGVRAKKRIPGLRDRSPSPVGCLDKRKGSYFSGKGSLAEDSLHLQDDAGQDDINGVFELIATSETILRENRELITFLETALVREELPMTKVLDEIPWLQELRSITQNMTEYRLADESKHQEFLAKAEEMEYKVLNSLASKGVQVISGADVLGKPEDYLGQAFKLDAIDTAARNVNSIQLISLCKNTKEVVKNYLKASQGVAIQEAVGVLCSKLCNWGHLEPSEVLQELESLLRKETNILLGLHASLQIVCEAIVQSKPIHAFALDYLKYLFEACQTHAQFLLPALNAVIDPPVLTFAKLAPIQQPLEIVKSCLLNKLKLRYCDSILSKIESAESSIMAMAQSDNILEKSAASDSERITKSYNLASQVSLLNELAALREARVNEEIQNSPALGAPPPDAAHWASIYHLYYLSSICAGHKARQCKHAGYLLSLPQPPLCPAYPGDLHSLAWKYEGLLADTKAKAAKDKEEGLDLIKRAEGLKNKSDKIAREMRNVERIKEGIQGQLGEPSKGKSRGHKISRDSRDVKEDQKSLKLGQGEISKILSYVKDKTWSKKFETKDSRVEPIVPKLLKVPVDVSVFKSKSSCQSISASSQRFRSSSRQQIGSSEQEARTIGVSKLNSASRTTLQSRGSNQANKENIQSAGGQQHQRVGNSGTLEFLNKLTESQITNIKEVHKKLVLSAGVIPPKESTRSQIVRRLLKHLEVSSPNPQLYNILAQGVYFSIPVRKGPKLKSGYTGVKKVDVAALWTKFGKSNSLVPTPLSSEELKSSVNSYLEKLGFQSRELKVNLDQKSVQFLNLSKMITNPMKRAGSPEALGTKKAKLAVLQTSNSSFKDGLQSPIEPMGEYSIHIDEVSKKALQDRMAKHKSLLSSTTAHSDNSPAPPCPLFVWEFTSKDLSHSYQVVFPSLDKVLCAVLLCVVADIPI